MRASLISLVALASYVSAFSGKTCRIMPLGASITFGVGSSHGNGYRDDLYNLIANDGNTVNMVGTQRGGDFVDPDNEGWPGLLISEVDAKGQISMPINRPNIATVLVGTNDMTRNVDVANAPARLGKLIDDVLAWPTLTLVVVSTLPPNADTASNVRINAYNAALAGVVKQRTDAGRSVILVDSHAVVGLGDLVDGTHPNDAAYERMGRVFYDGIVRAETLGWIFPVDGPAP
ncbi:lipolytic enzyme [Mycena crocata]|nr:lipolytic enzyme [Mycena crocata]